MASHIKTKRKNHTRLRHLTSVTRLVTSASRPHQLRNRLLLAPMFPLLCNQVLAMDTQLRPSHSGAIPCMFDTDSALVGIDNRASACMSDRIEDFCGPLVTTNRIIRGFGGTKTANVQMGTIEWRFDDDNGRVSTHRIPNSYYVPGGKVRLLSPQHWAQTLHHSKRTPKGIAAEMTYFDRVELRWDGTKSTKTVLLDPHTNVATFTLAPSYKKFEAYCHEAKIDENYDDEPVCVSAELVSDDEYDDDSEMEPDIPAPRNVHFNLEGPCKYTDDNAPSVIVDEEERQPDNISAEFLRYHHKFNHLPPKRIQLMARRGIIPHRLAKCPVPACTACMYGKAIKRKWRDKNADNQAEAYVPTRPGEVVSVDQMISATPGLIAQMTGWPCKARYKCATVFMDQASDYSYVVIQKGTSADETVEAKMVFERFASDNGIKIQHYHADNGVFKTNQWKNHCMDRGQGFSFAGVNAHHQNGRAERRIRTLQELSRTSLIHAHRRWPEAITANLWPYALRIANEALNHSPSTKHADGRIPASSFSNTPVVVNAKYWQPFGCPVYVLSEALQTTGIQNKWKERARVGLYLGTSPIHARSVALVLNLQTGMVSPQFHVQFDPSFRTMRTHLSSDLPQSLWQEKTGFITANSEGASMNFVTSASNNKRKARRGNAQSILMPQSEGETTPSLIPARPAPIVNSEHTLPPVIESDNPTIAPPAPEGEIALPTGPLGRAIVAMTAQVDAFSGIYDDDYDPSPELFSMAAIAPDAYMDPYNHHPLLAMGATNDPDTLYYHEAMKAPDKEQFLSSMNDEVSGQLANKVYRPMLRSELPEGAIVLPSVWAMRRKRKASTGEIYRYKSRLNIGGHKQREGLDYEQTYAPVVTWPAIRLLLSLVLLNKWHTRQIDYVQAYPQAPIDRPMYMEIPNGFQIDSTGIPVNSTSTKDDSYVLEVLQNIYGQKQAGRVWNLYLVERLKEIGFTPSKYDPCVFYKGRSMYVLYTDDSILAGPDPKELDAIIQEMTDHGLKITSEGGIEDFLGITIERKEDGTYELTQKKLIESILSDLGLDKGNVVSKDTPSASSKLLSRHPGSPEFDGHFDYRSVIGKLNYLEKSTRPDIAYIVHQCARFCADPRVEHGQAIKWLGRYLHGTKMKGLIMKPTKDATLEMHVDSDWSGNWDPSIAATDSSTARSRHGFLLTYCGCPLFWASQLQTEIALSSTEAEYIGLSKALREAIPIMKLMKEMKKKGFQISVTQPKVMCRVFEDNSGALEMANTHKFRPRTKHLNIKYHHFRSYVNTAQITIHPIESKNNLADMLTKGQPLALFRIHRYHIMGWDIEREKGCTDIDRTGTGHGSKTIKTTVEKGARPKVKYTKRYMGLKARPT